MPICTVKSVSIDQDTITLNVESDLMLGANSVQFTVSINRSNFAYWNQDNPGTMDDYILAQVKSRYELLKKVSAKAQTLINKVLTW